MNTKIRVLIVDDHPFFRQGVRFFLDSLEDIEVVGEAENGQQAVQIAHKESIDLILLDIQMPKMDGIDTTKALIEFNPELHVLILTSFGQEDKIAEAIDSGASGYCLKNASPEELVAAVHAVAAGGTYLGKGITPRLISTSAKYNSQTDTSASRLSADQQETNKYSQLTRRELDVLEKVADGLSNKEIASVLFVSEKTVKTHIANIFHKLDVNTRTQAALDYSNRKRLEVNQND